MPDQIHHGDGSRLNPMYGRIISGNTLDAEDMARVRRMGRYREIAQARMILLAHALGFSTISLTTQSPGVKSESHLPINEKSVAAAAALLETV